jgi:hypothetical protein
MINVLTPMARRWLARTLLLTAPLLVAPSWAQQADDPPGRIAYISALEGQVMTAPDASAPWAAAGLNWPITTGTRVATEGSARAELHAGWMALRLQGRSLLDVTRLDDSTAQAALTDGRLSLRLLELPAGQRAEIDTPQLALVADQAGEYRVDVDPGSDTTRITVHSGTATVFGEAGQASTVRAPQQVIFAGRNLNVVQRHNVGPRDALDQWSASRDQLERQSQSASYVSRDMPGYQLLDQYGQWGQDPTYGAVWYPSITVTDWAPYRYGRWSWVEPWGWTWIDDAPWGFAPSHYGRWAQIGPRWAWVPGPRVARPVYAPALVGFVGGNGWGVSINSGAAWFPLAPGEYWQPGYRVSDRYRDRVNWGRPRPPNWRDDYRYRGQPGAISVAQPGDFGGRHDGDRDRNRPGRYGDGSRLPPGVLTGGQIVQPPARSVLPDHVRDATPMPRPNVRFNAPPDSRPDARPDGRTDTRPTGRIDGRPDGRTDDRAATRPDTRWEQPRPGNRSDTRFEPRPAPATRVDANRLGDGSPAAVMPALTPGQSRINTPPMVQQPARWPGATDSGMPRQIDTRPPVRDAQPIRQPAQIERPMQPRPAEMGALRPAPAMVTPARSMQPLEAGRAAMERNSPASNAPRERGQEARPMRNERNPNRLDDR